MPNQDHPDCPPLFDPDDALARAAGRPEVARELFAMLRASIPETIESLRTARGQDDLEQLREAAHRLHGASLYCGVPRLRGEVATLERLCGARDPEAVDEALDRLLATLADISRLDGPTEGPAGGMAD